MKYTKCEVGGCNKEATRKIKNGHRICEDCLKMIRHGNKTFGHNVFFKEVLVGHIGKYGMYVDVPVKFA